MNDIGTEPAHLAHPAYRTSHSTSYIVSQVEDHPGIHSPSRTPIPSSTVLHRIPDLDLGRLLHGDLWYLMVSVEPELSAGSFGNEARTHPPGLSS